MVVRAAILRKFAGQLWLTYKTGVLIIVNTILILVVLNLTASVALKANRRLRGHKPVHPLVAKYGWPKLHAAYPNLPRDELQRLLDETWGRPFHYEPYSGYKEQPFQGRYVNVDTNGLRLVRDQGPWPPASTALNVFVLGGSTTFGFGVGDFETIPSLLQDQLNARLGGGVKVYNLGVGGYYSGKEFARFQRLIAKGLVPDAVVFVDGLNEFLIEADSTEQVEVLSAVMRGDYLAMEVHARVSSLALVDLMNSLKRKLLKPAPVPSPPNPTERKEALRAICKRYLRIQRLAHAAAESFGVKSCFVWQPVPVYQYDLSNFLFDPQWTGADQKTGYEVMVEVLKTNAPPRNFLWLADIQKELKENLYVDQVHYNPRMNGLIAAKIADYLIGSGSFPSK